MEAFEYISLDGTGRTKKGIIQADNAKQARQLLRAQKLTPIEIQQVIERPIAGGDQRRFRIRFKKNELPLIIRQLATLVEAGLPIDDALLTLQEQSDHRNTERILSTLHAKVMEGQSLAYAMRLFPKAFDELVATSVEAGEQAGQLAEVLLQLADYLETRETLGKKSLSALVYPMILIVTAIAVVAGLMVYIVPKVIDVFASANVVLPLMTRVLIAMSHFLSHYGWLLLLILALLILAFITALQKPEFKLRWHGFVLKLPVFGSLSRTAQSARFTRTLGILTHSAVPIVSALSLASQVVRNEVMKRACQQVASAVREGSSVAGAMRSVGEFPSLTVKLVHSGEQSGRLSDMLNRIAMVQERDVESKLTTLTNAIQPLAILFVGLMVLFIVLAMLLPIFQINTLLN
ncbi:MAG: type II secretion system protein GspF [Proteobacteria bacterium]|nr:MAG: type II secretion system protein GspF [Pseudomonadota bacterium]